MKIIWPTIAMMSIYFSDVSGQATTISATNTPVAVTDYLGWSTSKDVDFKTGGTQYMILDGTTNIGFFGLSNTTGFTPQRQLHQNWTGNTSVFHQFTNGNTGTGGTDGFRLGINYEPSYSTAPSSFVKFIQEENAPMKFYTGSTSSGVRARMIINGDYSPTIRLVTNHPTNGYVGIGEDFFWDEESGTYPQAEGPRSLLHMQGPFNAYAYGGQGWRSWMKTGTYINENSDEIYIGLKNEFDLNGTNRSDAVIAWGDDLADPDQGLADAFRLIFSGSSTGSGTGTDPYSPQTFSGRETMRMTAWGRMGIGATFSSGQSPARRLEILDYQESLSTTFTEPQLRITHTQATAGSLNNTGIWTDFRTTQSGNLHILPKNAGAEGRVGINVDPSILAPLGTLHLITTDINLPDLVLHRPSDVISSISTTSLGDLVITTNDIGLGFTQRYVGIHIQTPQSELHQHLNADINGAPQEVFHQFTNSSTLSGATNGLKIGIDPNGIAEFRQQESEDMNFYTDYANNSSPEVTITDIGNVGINQPAPSSSLFSRVLEINSGGSPTSGQSGLKFTNLTDSYWPGATATKFLTVDVNGEVVLRDDAGAGGGIGVCGGSGKQDFLPLFSNPTGTTICTSIVRQGTYGIPSAIGVGYPSSILFKGILDVNGDLNLGQTGLTPQFKINNLSVLHIPGTQNTFVGATTGTINAYLGRDNTLVGYALGTNITTGGEYNTIIGSSAGTALTTGDYNYIGGAGAALGVSTGSYNVIIGASSAAAYNSINATFMGYRAAYNSAGSNNTVLGFEAMYQSGTTSTGTQNTIVGLQAGYDAGNGSSNVYMGQYAGYTADGSDNVFIGHTTGYNNSTGVVCNSSTLVGDNVKIAGGSRNNVTAIGATARPNCTDCVTLGDVGATNNDRTLLGYASAPTVTATVPASRLYVDVVAGETSAAFFNGNVYSPAGMFTTSDANLKTNIQTLPAGFSSNIIEQLSPKSYSFDQANHPQLHLQAGQQVGLIAQEVEQILPDLVAEFTTPPLLDTLGNVINPELTFKGLNYAGIIPYLIQGMKDQQDLIEGLQAQINNCCNSGNRITNPNNEELGNAIDVELKNTKAIILNQNVPNPFAEQTTITYFITDEVMKAQIFFYDNKGTILKIVDINEKGSGQLNVFGADLSSGNYTYTLIADGTVIQTKKMIKQ